MRKMFLLAAIIGCMCSCEHIELTSETTTENANTRNVQFVVKNLDVDYGETRATVTSEGMTDLYVWEGATLLCHQTSSDTDFGAPTISLTIGAHDLTFVTSKSDGQSWASGVWTCSRVKDTYGTVLSYTVSKSSSSKQVELTRVNGKVMWTIEDAIPSTATTANVSVEQCYGLNAILDGVNTGSYSNSFNISSVQGATGVTVSVSVLPSSHSEGMTVNPSISITDGTNAICTYTNEVTIMANEIANIHGSFFSGSGGMTLTLNSEWAKTTDYDVK